MYLYAAKQARVVQQEMTQRGRNAVFAMPSSELFNIPPQMLLPFVLLSCVARLFMETPRLSPLPIH